MSRLIWSAIVVGGVGALAAMNPSAQAQLLRPVTQERSVRGFVIVPPCGGTTDNTIIAPDYGEFDQEAVARRECPDALGSGLGRQQSRIEDAALIASGRAESVSDAEVNTVIQALGFSDFRVAFALPTASRFRLMGSLMADASTTPQILAVASVSLLDSERRVMFMRVADPGIGDDPLSLSFDDIGELQPGQYTLVAGARTAMDAIARPGGGARAEFQLTLRVDGVCPADRNRDGTIDSADFFDFLDNFFRNDNADFNLDGFVNSADFFDFLAAFFTGC